MLNIEAYRRVVTCLVIAMAGSVWLACGGGQMSPPTSPDETGRDVGGDVGGHDVPVWDRLVWDTVTPEYAIALSNLRSHGYAVSAVLNVFDEYDFARCAGPLMAAGIPVFHLKDEESIVHVCRQFVLR